MKRAVKITLIFTVFVLLLTSMALTGFAALAETDSTTASSKDSVDTLFDDNENVDWTTILFYTADAVILFIVLTKFIFGNGHSHDDNDHWPGSGGSGPFNGGGSGGHGHGGHHGHHGGGFGGGHSGGGGFGGGHTGGGGGGRH